MSETREKEIIEGTVEDIRFRNEQNGYTVLSLIHISEPTRH